MLERHLTPSDFNTVADLAKFPYLTRKIIREQGKRLHAENYPAQRCQFRRSGGTTGEPIRVAADIHARAMEVAAYLRGFEWMEYRLGAPMVRLFGGSLGMHVQTNLRARMREWVLNNHFLPAFELSLENLDQYTDVIHKAVGGVLVGYASAIRNMAEYMAQSGMQGSPLRSVICTAEYMPQAWRSFISEVFEAPVYCYYGCGEVNSIAYESADEEGYLVTQEHVVLEVCGTEHSVFRDEGYGEACVTTLFNYAMPLIRYRNGDVLELKYLNNGRTHQRISKLEGRVVDQLQRCDGSSVSGALIPHMVLRSGFPAWKYQLVQTELDHIILHYKLSPGASPLSMEMQGRLTSVLRDHLGRALRVDFVEGDFEVSRSGKHRFVINLAQKT